MTPLHRYDPPSSEAQILPGSGKLGVSGDVCCHAPSPTARFVQIPCSHPHRLIQGTGSFCKGPDRDPVIILMTSAVPALPKLGAASAPQLCTAPVTGTNPSGILHSCKLRVALVLLNNRLGF